MFVCVCGVQGDSFIACISSSPLLVESDVLTVLDLSENAIRDNGAAALAATMAAAGQAPLQCWAHALGSKSLNPAPCSSSSSVAQQRYALLEGCGLGGPHRVIVYGSRADGARAVDG